MGVKRFLKKMVIPGYYSYEASKKISENGVKDGIKEIIKEDIEDIPGISHVYKMGRYEGKKEGYSQASYEYEEKLLKQAEEFLNQKKEFSNQKEEYEELLDEYEQYIKEMQSKETLSKEEQEYLSKIIIMENKLVKRM